MAATTRRSNPSSASAFAVAVRRPSGQRALRQGLSRRLPLRGRASTSTSSARGRIRTVSTQRDPAMERAPIARARVLVYASEQSRGRLIRAECRSAICSPHVAARRAEHGLKRGPADSARPVELFIAIKQRAAVYRLMPRGPAREEPARAGDIAHSLADIERARQNLGYRPSYDVSRGLELSVPWYAGQCAPEAQLFA